MDTAFSEFLPVCGSIWLPCSNAQQPWEAWPVKGVYKDCICLVPILIKTEWYLVMFWGWGWLWQCTGQMKQSCLQETASTRSYCWMSLLLHSVCYMTLWIAQEQTIICIQDGGNSAYSGSLQAGWLSPTFPSILHFFCCCCCTLLYWFLNIILAVCFHYYKLPLL